MDIFLKIIAGILISAVLCLILSKTGTEISLLLCISVCSMVMIAAFSYWSPVLEFAQKLIGIGKLNSNLMQILFKAAGIGLLSQITCVICEDIGNKSLSKVLQLTASTLILSISIPALESLLVLIEAVLGEV